MKKRKNNPRKFASRQSSKTPHKALARVATLIEDGNYDEAYNQLSELVQQYPRNEAVLGEMLYMCHQLQHWTQYMLYADQLLPLKRGREQADLLNDYVFIAGRAGYIALAWHMAERLIQEYPTYPDLENVKQFARLTDQFFHEETDHLINEANLTPDERRQILVAHDRIHFYTETMQADKAIELGETVLSQHPTIIPIRNNISQALFMRGRTAEAIEHAQQVLAQDSQNFHALANITRFTFLMAQFEVAQQYHATLQNLTGDSLDFFYKQAETAAFFGDDETIRSVYLRAKKQAAVTSSLRHLAGVAYFRLGKRKTAWKLWEAAANNSPLAAVTQSVLQDRYLPVGQQNVPWYWPLFYWLPAGFEDRLTALLKQAIKGKQGRNETITQMVRGLLQEYPYLVSLMPHILELGDGAARHYVVTVCKLAETPEMMQILYDFALGEFGTDELRLEAIKFISQFHPELLPESREVWLYMAGEYRPMLMMAFEIYSQPNIPKNVPKSVINRLTQAYELLMRGQAAQAERMLKEIIAAAPDFPSAYNQLGVAYQMQGKTAESIALLEETFTRFPDYLFARVAMARTYAQNNQLDEAKALLEPIMLRRRLHIAEFRALAQAQMDLGLAEKRPETAESWLNLWASVEPDNPELDSWRRRITGNPNRRSLFGKRAS
ncbi:MAG: tetratricopeptide repeat protein [Anaerolineae bacterium]|nr:tetratricopeptide repeat protein [Anaerolineae bacterium]